MNPLKLLALALLSDVVEDIKGINNGSARMESVEWLRDSALIFCLSDESDEDFRFWCGAANVDPELIREGIKELVDG